MIDGSELSLSGGYFFEHSEVSLQAEPGVLESGRFVLFEEEVASPGEPIADYRSQEEVSDGEGEEDGSQELKQCQDGSDEVKSPAGSVGVLREVERVEVLETLVLYLHQQIIINLTKTHVQLLLS